MQAQPHQTINLSACLIVRDSARTLRACLESIRPWVDELVVVDTGSLDDTADIALKMGGRVFHFPWCDDFSAARNESLQHARGKWIFWMDSDDTIDPINGRRLRQLVEGEVDPTVLGFVMQVHCPGPDGGGQGDVTVVDHVKLFRNGCDLHFEGRIHEQILPAIRRAGGTVAWTDIFIVHSGHDHTPAGQQKKRARDLRLLELELRERPDHPFTLFNFGMTYTDMERYEEAADYLSKCVHSSQPSESHLRKAYALLVYDYKMLRRPDDAWNACQDGLRLFPGDPELQFRSGVLLHEMGRYRDAADAYRRAMLGDGELHFGSYDIGIKGFKARHNLAITLTELGDLAAAEVQWREITREEPSYLGGWRGLGESLVKQEKHTSALALADLLDRHPSLRAESALLRARIYEIQADLVRAWTELERATELEPADCEILSRLCEFAFRHRDPHQAELPLKSLLAMNPHDASAQHNLGTVYFRTGRHSKAVECYRRAIDLRPDFADSYLYLGHCLEKAGVVDEALAAWRRALAMSPECADASAAIERVLGKRVHIR
jgi:tetratricopeptide (TPR) repeat protein